MRGIHPAGRGGALLRRSGEWRRHVIEDWAQPALHFVHWHILARRVGHCWLHGTPAITAPNAVCLDFSVAKKGYLIAYRWSGETPLSEGNLVSGAERPLLRREAATRQSIAFK